VRKISLLLASTLLLAHSSFAQELNQNSIVASLTTNTFTRSGNTLYIGGAFTTLGTNTPNLFFGNTSGQVSTNFPRPNGSVTAAISDGVGGWYISGTFSLLGNQTRSRIARINADGSLHPWTATLNSSANVMLLVNGTLYIGGGFTNVSGQLRNRLAALDTATGLATDWNPNSTSFIYSLASNGSELFVGGNFTTIGGQARNRFASFEYNSSTPTAFNPDMNAAVNAIYLTPTQMYVGGAFTDVGNDRRARFSVFNVNSSLPVTFTSFSARLIRQNETAAQVVCDWSTGSEQNSDYFQVERSSDGRTFYPSDVLQPQEIQLRLSITVLTIFNL
jgi:hypothetical protein